MKNICKVLTLLMIIFITQITLAQKTLILDNSPLTEKELQRKDSIQRIYKPITEEEFANQRVLFYDFRDFDKLIALRVFGYLIDNPEVLKINFTKDAIAIVATKGLDEEFLLANIHNTGVYCEPITKEQYLESLNRIN